MFRSNRNMENFFINGRYIKSKTASAALEQAYASKIPHDKFPFCVLNIILNPAAVDVNVHPAKLEVKFANEKVIFDAIYYAVLTSLEAAAKRPELEMHTPAQKTTSGYTTEQLRNAFAPLDKPRPRADQITMTSAPSGTSASQAQEKKAEPKVPDYSGVYEKYNLSRPKTAQKPATDIELPDFKSAAVYAKSSEAHAKPEEIPREEVKQSTEAVRVEQVEEIQTPIEETPADVKTPHEAKAPDMPYIAKQNDPYAEICAFDPKKIPDYLIIGEAFNTYVIVQIGEEILMIDKHAAHERIIFDELCRKMREGLRDGSKTAIGGQMLLSPIELKLLSPEIVALEEYGDKIKALGFDYTYEKTGASTYKASVFSIPDTLDASAAEELFSTLAEKLSDNTASVESAATGFFETRLWQASCKAAIKGGRVYDMAHIKWICDRLLMTPEKGSSVIRTCPHGRPVAFEIKKSSIDRQFGR